jgi:hypothetical protein
MMKNIVKAVTITLLMTGCDDKYDKVLRRLSHRLDTKDWEVLFPVTEIGEMKHFQFEKSKGDTSMVLHIYLDNKSDSLSYRINKNFTDSDFGYRLLYGDDTLYYYKFPLGREKEKEFIRGKYYYLRSRLELSEGQACYFDLHQDSLTSIPGNNLPPLPEITCKK